MMAIGQPCPSTHGGSGYPPQTVVAPDGKLYCPFCGTEMDPRFYREGQARYIDRNMGIPDPPRPPTPWEAAPWYLRWNPLYWLLRRGG